MPWTAARARAAVAVAGTIIVTAPRARAAAPAGVDHAPGSPRPPFVIAIDGGHGGSNHGAAGITIEGSGPDAGRTIFEKQITLALARRLRSQLVARGEYRVVLCRDADVMLPLRARGAEQARADLFISLHANASPPSVVRGTRRGFEVYVLSPQERQDDTAGRHGRTTRRWPERAGDAVCATHEVLALAEGSILAAR